MDYLHLFHMLGYLGGCLFLLQIIYDKLVQRNGKEKVHEYLTLLRDFLVLISGIAFAIYSCSYITELSQQAIALLGFSVTPIIAFPIAIIFFAAMISLPYLIEKIDELIPRKK